MIYLALVVFLFWLFLAGKNFRLAVGLFIVTLPAYLIRFFIGPLPTTALEIAFGAIFLVWLFKYGRNDITDILKMTRQYRHLSWLISIFLLLSITGIFTNGNYWPALGTWRAYFLEPVLFFLILIGRRQKIELKFLIWALLFSALSVSFYSIFQYFTGHGIATAGWTALATRRVTAFYTSPNAVGLYLAPIFMLLPVLWNKKNRWLILVVAVLFLSALYFTKSQGAWIGLGAGIVTFIFLLDHKKIATGVVIFGILFLLVVPSLRTAILFKDRASSNRLILWGQTWNYLTRSPANFVFGAGLRQFYDKVQKPVHDWKRIERHIYPHNIFLNFWSEIGLFGMLSFSALLTYLFYLSYLIKKKNLASGAAFFSILVVFFVHGLVDVPYFKNDLAFLFWIIVAYVIYSLQPVNSSRSGGA